MKKYLLILTLIPILVTTQIKASISKEAEEILQTYFSHDKTFKRQARKALRKDIKDSEDQKKLMNAVVLYRPGIHSADNLSRLLNLLAAHMLSDTFDDLTSNVNIIIDAYSDDHGRLKGKTLLHTINALSVLSQRNLLITATKALKAFADFPDFKTHLNFSRVYLTDCFLRPLVEQPTWSAESTKNIIKRLNLDKEEMGHISVMTIDILYEKAKKYIENT
ncbi:MAG: hypothetical protein GW748_05895 [Alphaproteobacteria bacterium]|nr:hypothetical protein [Alphaproteobacteria bacterium]NCQ67258.1 hypothetical protein [Alphaproteobacteria bacterium]NCT07101.1 hypothetical protein [Alphaproteobacteria bacterium]